MKPGAPRPHRDDDPIRALRDSESRLQQVLDNSSAAVFAKDRNGRYLFVNREFERLVGLDSEQLIGRTDRDIFPPDLAAGFRRNDMRVLLEGRALEFEESGTFAGEQRTYLSSKFPLFDSDNVPYAVCGVATDITRRKQIESALSSSALAVSAERGRELFVGLSRYLAAILDVDVAFIAEMREDDPSTMHVLGFVNDGTPSEHFDYALADTACETVVGHGFRIYPAGLGDHFPLDDDFREMGAESYAGYPLNDTQGRPLGIISILARRPLEQPEFIESVMKIFAVRAAAELERLRSDQALLASQASYRQIFEASEDAIFVHDHETGRIVDVNPKACSTYGYSYEEMLQVPVDRLGSGEPPYTGAEAAAHLQRARELGSTGFLWHRRNKDNSLHWDEVFLKVASIGGQPRILAFTRDITERKLAEERRSRLEAQLLQAKKMEALGHLTGGIAHDFNNLLASIMGYVVLASERPASAEDERLGGYLEKALQSCTRARDLIRQMLMFSRGQKGDPQPVDVGERIRQSQGMLHPTIASGISVVLEIESDAGIARIDPVQFDQVLMNLCVNACDALRGNGVLRIGARRHAGGRECASCRQEMGGDYVELFVQDDGPGIPPDVLDRIFEPFFSTKPNGKGTGMGLATVHGIVHEHGGHLLVESRPGMGTRIGVLLPRCDECTYTQDATLATTSPPMHALHGRVVLVDDERSVGEFLCELLSTWGLQADFVDSPQQALGRLCASPHEYQIVITDHSMPVMTGLQLADRLNECVPQLPVLLYTGLADSVETQVLPANMVREVLHKPIDHVRLARVLSEVLGPAPVDG